jgi:predicted pyridoxine 5'-phosphate oxidase superfamily flavin-nucleotide-binding protein
MGALTNDMQRVVREQRLAYVATVNPDGTPNLSPKGTTTVWDDDHLIFADIRSPGTVANLRRNPAVEVNVVNWFTRKGYRFSGMATVHTDGPLFEQGLALYTQPGLSDAPRRIRAIVLIQVTRAQPLLSPAYDRDTTEEQVRDTWERYYQEIRPQSAAASDKGTE